MSICQEYREYLPVLEESLICTAKYITEPLSVALTVSVFSPLRTITDGLRLLKKCGRGQTTQAEKHNRFQTLLLAGHKQ